MCFNATNILDTMPSTISSDEQGIMIVPVVFDPIVCNHGQLWLSSASRHSSMLKKTKSKCLYTQKIDMQYWKDIRRKMFLVLPQWLMMSKG